MSLKIVCSSLLALIINANAAILRASPQAPQSLTSDAAAAIPEVVHMLDMHSLMGSITQVRRLSSTAVLMKALPEWASPMPQCAKAVNATLTKVSSHYLPAHVDTVLHQSCEDFHVYSDIGGSKDSCRELMAELTEEFNGNRNYYTWCRSLTLSSFGALKKMKEMFASNETMTKLGEQCAQHCPYVQKTLEAGAVINLYFEKFMFGGQPDEEEDPEHMYKVLEVVMRQFNQMCDFREKAICSAANMPESCFQYLEATGNSVDDLETLENECDSRQPCRKACHGVDSHLFDFTMEQMRLSQQVPLPSAQLGVTHCQSIDTLMTCTAKEECNAYLTRKVSPEHPSAHDYLKSWEPVCAWFKNPCASQREATCKTQVQEFNHEWHGNFACLVSDVTEECCKTFKELAECDMVHHCGQHLNAGIPLLEIDLEKRIQKSCYGAGNSSSNQTAPAAGNSSNNQTAEADAGPHPHAGPAEWPVG